MAARFDPGQLRHKLTLQQCDHAPDVEGGFTVQWTDVTTMWAALKPVSADVLLRAGIDEVDISHRIIVRHTEIILPDMRFNLNGRIFTVRTTNDLDETARYTAVLTREGVV